MSDRHQQLRLVEALLFASAEPLDAATIGGRLPEGADVPALIAELAQLYANRGVNLVAVGDKWAFRTAPDLGQALRSERVVPRKLSRVAVETLAVIAYHQPVTRSEIEEIRGVSLSRGTLDNLLEAGWVKPGRRRNTPGRPVTWVTTESFLDQFGLGSVKDLPAAEELKAAGLLDKRPAIAAYGAARPPEEASEESAEPEEPLEGEEADLAEALAELDPAVTEEGEPGEEPEPPLEPDDER